MDVMLRQGAVDAFIDNGDGLFTKGKNFFVVDRSISQAPRLYLPWDLDGVFRSTSAGIYGISMKGGKLSQSPYQQIILNQPEMRQRYNDLLMQLISGPFSSHSIHRYLESVSLAVSPHLRTDPYHSESAADFESLKTWLQIRSVSILKQIQVN
jgi:hypothetical protein